MRPPGQLPLGLGHRAARGREDFLVAPSNQDAVSWIDRWTSWPRGVLAIHGFERQAGRAEEQFSLVAVTHNVDASTPLRPSIA